MLTFAARMARTNSKDIRVRIASQELLAVIDIARDRAESFVRALAQSTATKVEPEETKSPVSKPEETKGEKT